MPEHALQFGDRDPGHTYLDRPGVYGVALNDRREVLVVEVAHLLVLPGGGIEAGENRKTALKRECLEEAGYPVRVRSFLGQARQFVRAISDGVRYNKHCQFYRVEISGPQAKVSEPGHMPRWIPLDHAKDKLSEGAQRWALSQL